MYRKIILSGILSLSFWSCAPQVPPTVPPTGLNCRKTTVEGIPCIVCSTQYRGEFSMSCDWDWNLH